MKRIIPESARTRKRFGAGVALVVATLAGLFIFGVPAASAHHPNVEGKSTCATDGSSVVNFKSVSWRTDGYSGGANSHIDIAYGFGDGKSPSPTTWTVLPWKSSYAYTSANSYQFSDSFTVPSNAPGAFVQLRATAVSNWGNNYHGGQTEYSGWIELSKDCQPPGVAAVSTSVACVNGAGDVTVTLKNTASAGAHSVHFEVTNDSKTDTKDVAPGKTETIVLKGLSDGSHTIKIKADGKSLDKSVDVDCNHPGKPNLNVDSECTTNGGRVVVTLENTTKPGEGPSIDFVVTNPMDDTKTTKVSVAPGKTEKVTFEGVSEGKHSVKIKAGDKETVLDVTVNCHDVAAKTIAANCTDKGEVLTLQNSGLAGVELTVWKGTTKVKTVTVPANGSVDVLVPMIQGEKATIVVKDQDDVVASKDVTFTCSETPPTTGTTIAPTTPSSAVLAATVTRAPAPTGTLPVTGSNLTVALTILGLCAVAAGACVLLAVRARRTA